MTKDAPCVCNRCSVRGHGFQICRCRVVAYCSRRCFELDINPGDPKCHLPHCVASSRCWDIPYLTADFTFVLQKRWRETECTGELEPGKENLLLSQRDPSEPMFGFRRGVLAPGTKIAINIPVMTNWRPRENMSILYNTMDIQIGKSALLRSEDHPGARWFTSRVQLASGTTFVVVVPPKGTSSVTICSKKACTMVAVLCRSREPTIINVCIIPSRYAQMAADTAYRVVNAINDLSSTPSGSPSGHAALGFFESLDCGIAKWIWLCTRLRPCGESPSGYEWLPKPEYPISLLVRGRPEVSRGVLGPMLTIGGEGGNSNFLMDASS